MLCEESAISPEVVAARGYHTARKPSEVPDAFSEKQRRCTGLVIPLYSPDGQTISYQVRPNYPLSPSRKYENPHGSKIIADVHPFMRNKIKDASEPVFFTEGPKTADALTSRGVCTVMLAGVWNFAKPDTKCRELLPCLEHVPLKGRLVYVGYDADSRTNPDVQDALGRFVARLEERGAKVLVVSPPVVNGDPKTGIDDYLAAGGNLDELLRSAKPFEPVDIRRERLSRDEALRRTVAELWATWEALPVTTQGQCTVRAVVRALVRHAEEHGKPTGDGRLEVRPSLRTLAKDAGVSQQTVSKTMERIEESGIAVKSPKRRKRKEAQTYVLSPNAPGGARQVDTMGRGRVDKERQEGETRRMSHTYGESSPCVNLARGGHGRAQDEKYDPCVNPPEGAQLPEFRATKVIHQWERIAPPKGGEPRWRVVDSEVIARLGKRRGEMFRAVLEADHRVDIVAELMPRFAGPKTRVRDFKRRMLPDLLGYRMERVARVELGPPILEMDEAGETVAPVPQWFENLQVVRENAGEIEDEKLQAEKIARQRERFHNPPPEADPEPRMPTDEEIRRLLAHAEARDEASRIAEQRSKAGMTVEVFIHDTVAQLGRIRLGLLRDLWRDRGGDPSHVWRAVQALRCKLERLAEHDNELFVFPPSERENPEPAEVVDLRPRVPESEPTLEPEPEAEPEYSLSHGCLDLGCDCLDCSARAPRYARPYQSGGAR